MRFSVSSSLAFATNLCRLVVGLVLTASGLVKAVDPLGTRYKMEDYLAALSLGNILPEGVLTLAAVMLIIFEFVLGVALLLATRNRFNTVLASAFMLMMTVISVWLYVSDPVSDCGCFGDALHLTNGETLAKNIVLLLLTLMMVWRRDDMKPLLRIGNRLLVYNCSVVLVIAISSYSLYYLPLVDFRPYRVGVNIWQAMQIPEYAEQPEFETTFIMKKDGVVREFSLADYPDSTWEFVDSRSVMVRKGFEPPIHDFCLQTLSGEDVTEEILTRKGYTYLLIAPWLEKANDGNFGEIEMIYEDALSRGYRFYGITSSGEKAISHWRDITGAEYEFLHADATTLKTIVRSNPGLLLLKDGTIVEKKSYNEL